MLDWILNNKEWAFSGIGVTLIVWILTMLFKKGAAPAGSSSGSLQINNNFVASGGERVSQTITSDSDHSKSKSDVRILFVDDDVRFRVVKILQSDGWIYTKIVKDIKSLESPDVLEADILFIDVQGVGLALGFANEGLGLALALKNRFPNKKVVIYSTQESGERFNEALRRADDFLSKNADPYEFISIVERLADKL